MLTKTHKRKHITKVKENAGNKKFDTSHPCNQRKYPHLADLLQLLEIY